MNAVEAPSQATAQPSPLLWKCAILALLLAAVVWTGPAGNFPLNDDWAWGKDVRSILEGEWRYTGWEAMPLVPQALLGATISSVLHFDFTVLRGLTLTLCAITIWFLYDIVLMATDNCTTSGLCALLFLFNPLTYALSFSFMTDIPFLAIITPSIYFFFKYTKTSDYKHLYIAVLLCCLAALQRQLAVILGGCYALSLLFHQGWTRKNIPRAVIAGLAPYLVLALYEHALALTHNTPLLYMIRNAEFAQLPGLGLAVLSRRLAERFLVIASYCGFFFLPVILQVLSCGPYSAKRRFAFVCIALIVCLTAYAILTPDITLPFYGNVLTPSGIGPPLLRDVYILRMPHLPVFSPMIMFLTTALSLLGAAGLITAVSLRLAEVFTKGQCSRADVMFVFACLFLLAYSSIVSLFAGFYDRYILVAFLLLPLVLLQKTPRQNGKWFVVAAAGWITILATFSMLAERDYLAWNTAKWNALASLESEFGVTALQIDGGFEYNASRLYHPLAASTPGKSWWWVKDDEYMLAFGPMPNYDAIRAYPYPRLLFGGQGHILVLKRGT